MSITRSLTALVVACGALASLAAMPTAALEVLDDPGRFVDWWEHHGTAAAAIGTLHLVALAGALHVTSVLAGITLAAAARLPRAAVAVARLAPRSIRRHLVVGMIAGTVALPNAVVAQEPIVIVDVGADSSAPTPITVTDLGPVDTDSAGASVDTDATVEPTGQSTFRESFRAGSTAAVADAWLVECGDNLWTIAERTVADHHEGHAAPSEVARYWRSLIEANRGTVADPDLIHPGQVVTLPPVVTAGS